MRELEFAALDSVRGLLKRRASHYAPKPGDKCANCDTELQGLYCHACGQAADNHHRSIWHLIMEGFEGVLHMDSRLWRTLPPLFFRPGLLARDYMTGRLARHVPPFRTFLVSLLLFIFAAEAMIHKIQHDAEHAGEHAIQTDHGKTEHGQTDQGTGASHTETKASHGEKETVITGPVTLNINDKSKQTPEARAKAVEDEYQKTRARLIAERDAALAKAKTDIERDIITKSYEQGLITAEKTYKATQSAALNNDEISTRNLFSMTPEQRRETIAALEVEGDAGFGNAVKLTIAKAIDNPKLFILHMFTWGHRLAVLLLPIMTVILGLLYVYKRKFFIFDHFLVGCNILSFMFLTNAFGFVLPEVVRGPWFLILMFWTPVNIFMTLRGAYESGIFGALIKTLILWGTTMFSFLMLLLLLAWVAAGMM